MKPRRNIEAIRKIFQRRFFGAILAREKFESTSPDDEKNFQATHDSSSRCGDAASLDIPHRSAAIDSAQRLSVAGVTPAPMKHSALV